MVKQYQQFADGPWSYPVDTSLQAAEHIAPAQPIIAALVLHAVTEAGARGLTVVEFSDRYDIDRMSCQPRFTEQRLARKIADSGMRRKNPSGVNAIVWVLPQFVQASPEREDANG